MVATFCLYHCGYYCYREEQRTINSLQFSHHLHPVKWTRNKHKLIFIHVLIMKTMYLCWKWYYYYHFFFNSIGFFTEPENNILSLIHLALPLDTQLIPRSSSSNTWVVLSFNLYSFNIVHYFCCCGDGDGG